VNWPFQRIHDPERGYGTLLLWVPFSGGRWLARFRFYGMRMTSGYGFHNCHRTGIF